MSVRQDITSFAVTGVALLVLVGSATPLLSHEYAAPEVCCSDTGECPERLECKVSPNCGPESLGFCIPIG